MTFVLGWEDDDGVFICADSAVTHSRELRGSTSSFGEAQQVDRVSVEEGAVKLLELPRGVVAAVCGDATGALDFVLSVRTRLAFTPKPMPEILAEVGAFADPWHRFQVLIGHRVDGHPTLTVFDSADRSIENVGAGRFATFGSMPDSKKDLAARLVTAVRRHKLPPEARLAGALVALQSIGITDYLPQHGVGGAFFGARVTSDGVTWQPDLCYLTYPPQVFQSAPFIKFGDTKKEIPTTKAIETVRVLVRDGAGILLSSLGSPRGRVLIPPTSDRTEDEWQEIVLTAVPPPFRILLPNQHFGVLSTMYTKAMYIYNPGLRDGAFVIIERSGKTCVEAATRIVETLERATPTGSFDLTIITESEEGTDGNTYRVAVPA
jgi:hypothetical protein